MLNSALRELSDLNRQRKNDMQNSLNKNLLTKKGERNGSLKHSLTLPLTFFIENTPTYKWQLLWVNGWVSSVNRHRARVPTLRKARQSLDLLGVGGLEMSK